MKNPRPYPSFLLAVALAVACLPALRAEEAPTTIKFSDPAKPGTLKVILAHGDLRITGANTSEIAVKSDSKAVNKPRKDGMRVLTSSTSYALSEKDNTVTLDAMSEGWGGGSGDFRVTVPRNTNIVVQSSWGGDVTCTGIGGDIDIKSTNGEIRLDEIAGGVAVETVNGEIRANVRELHDNKPLTFTSNNGEVVIRVPSEAKANVRLRTQNGVVLTDFDDQVLVTKTETTTRLASPRTRGKVIALSGDKVREAARNMESRARELAAEASRATGDTAAQIRAEADKMRAEAEKMRADADKMRMEIDKVAVTIRPDPAPAALPAPPAPPAATAGATPAAAPAMPAMPAMPTISGGKLVTGTLNGGGPEISVSTMNGDVTLRKLEVAATTTTKK